MKLIVNGVYSVGYDKMVYNGGEVSVRIRQKNLAYQDMKSANITANITSSDDVMELLMLTDALRRINPKINIAVTLPYFPYARQDRVCNEGEALAVKVMAEIINSQKYDTVEVWDVHSDVTTALLNNCTNIHCSSMISHIPYIRDMMLVAPDAGAAKKIKKCADELKTSYLIASKVRDPSTGEISQTHLMSELIKTDVCIVDDICDGGRTFVELAKVVRPKMYTNKKLYLYVTHGIFSQGTGELRKYFDKVYCANPWDEKIDPGFVEKI